MKRFLLFALLVASSASAQSFNPAPYLEDFHQLLSEMSSHYANLEWVANDRRTDLPALKACTEERLRNAKSEYDARVAFQKFINALGDGHVEIRWPSPSALQPGTASPETSFCERMGYEQRDNNGGIDWSIFPDYKPLDGAEAADFPGGILHLHNQTPSPRTLGIVRIGLFSEHAHPALCRKAQEKLAKADNAECSGTCEDDFEYAVGDLLTAALERRVQALRAAGANRIVVDITGNGGGTNWVEPAARVLTQVPLKSPRIAFVKSEHWVKQLQERLDEVNADISRKVDANPPALIHAADIYRDAIAQASGTCARAVLWSGPPSALHCSLIASSGLYKTGTLAYARQDAFPSLKARYDLFSPLHYHYDEGANRLPLIVLVDHNTASSAEYFAAMLRDNRAATIVGSITAGCGCGFTNGGIPTTLNKTQAQVRLPDCIRLRADGSNEVAGITPDKLLPWSEHVSRYQQAEILKRWLESDISTKKNAPRKNP